MCDTVDVIAGYVDRYNMVEIADRMGIPYPTLMRKLNPHDPYQLSAREVIPLTTQTNDLALIRHLCQRCGGLFVKMCGRDGQPLDAMAIAEFAKESAEAMSAMADAVMDGKITRKEAIRVRDELKDTAEKAWSLIRRLDSVVDGHHMGES